MLPEIRLLEAESFLPRGWHFSRVAERMHLDQSTVSKKMDELEGQLGYLLFKHNHKTVELTEGGRKFGPESRIALLHVERAVQGWTRGKPGRRSRSQYRALALHRSLPRHDSPP
jgi:DNA-binding transcriptional LysR family regulator